MSPKEELRNFIENHVSREYFFKNLKGGTCLVISDEALALDKNLAELVNKARDLEHSFYDVELKMVDYIKSRQK